MIDILEHLVNNHILIRAWDRFMVRPVEYDRETVLSEAMNVFWGTGYFGTNMQQLIEATHLKPGSLYGAFSSKEALFQAALDHYGKMSVEHIRAVLHGQDSPTEGICAWINQIASEVSTQKNHGCLLVNTALEVSGRNPEIREKVNTYLDQIRDLLVASLTEAKEASEISSDEDPEMLAAFMLCTIWGLKVLGETSPSQAKVEGIRNQLLALIGK